MVCQKLPLALVFTENLLPPFSLAATHPPPTRCLPLTPPPRRGALPILSPFEDLAPPTSVTPGFPDSSKPKVAPPPWGLQL